MVQNERTKLLANALDRASTACFTVGIATPAAGYLYNVANFRAAAPILVLAVGVTGWFLSAIALHLIARRVLGGLQE
jgi:hypothetical protein